MVPRYKMAAQLCYCVVNFPMSIILFHNFTLRTCFDIKIYINLCYLSINIRQTYLTRRKQREWCNDKRMVMINIASEIAFTCTFGINKTQLHVTFMIHSCIIVTTILRVYLYHFHNIEYLFRIQNYTANTFSRLNTYNQYYYYFPRIRNNHTREKTNKNCGDKD